MSTETSTSPTTEPDVETLASVVAKTAAVVDGVTEDDLSKPTPCPEYDVEILLSHLIGWTRLFADCAAGGRPSEGDGDAYRLPALASAGPEYRTAADSLVAAFRDLGTDREITLMSSPVPASIVLGMSLGDQLAHGWDLATATGQDAGFTDEEAVRARTALGGMLSDEYRGEGKNFGLQVDVPETASEVDKFIAFTGRDPRR